jgi:hypothetical protein
MTLDCVGFDDELMVGFGTALFRTGVLTGAGEAALAAGAAVVRAGVFGAGAFDVDAGFLFVAMIQSPLIIQNPHGPEDSFPKGLWIGNSI